MEKLTLPKTKFSPKFVTGNYQKKKLMKKFVLLIVFLLAGCSSQFYVVDSRIDRGRYIKFCKNGYFIDIDNGWLQMHHASLVYGRWKRTGNKIKIDVIYPPNKIYWFNDSIGQVREYHRKNPDSLYIEIRYKTKEDSIKGGPIVFVDDGKENRMQIGGNPIVTPFKRIKEISVMSGDHPCYYYFLYPVKDSTSNYFVFQYNTTIADSACVTDYPLEYRIRFGRLYELNPITGKTMAKFKIRRKDKYKLYKKYPFCHNPEATEP